MTNGGERDSQNGQMSVRPPLFFRGHYQPKVPADLGYYDLRLPEVRLQQAELAREAGIAGFLLLPLLV